MVAANQAIRNGDYRHRQSISNQLRHSTHNPVESAQALARIIRDRIGTGQPLGSGYFRNLPDDTWSELVALLSPEELDAVHRVCDVDVYNPVDTISDDEPIPFEVTEPSHTPSWRDEHPALTHHLQWVDSDGCQHGLTIRCDSLDDLVRKLTQVKALISTAKAKADAQRTQEPKTDTEPELSSRRCELHDATMYKAVSKKTGRPYASHLTADGERCFGHKKA